MNKIMNVGCQFLILVFLIIMVVYGGIIWCIQSLWNWLAPLFWMNAPELTYLETVGCVLLIAIISGLIFNKNNNKD